MYYSLQIGRGLAALMVVLTHIAGPMSADKYFGYPIFEQMFSFGTFGVQFFFVLSGFIIYTVHKKDLSVSSKLLTYLKKRIIRIYPVYLVIIAAVYVVGLMTLPQGIMPNDFLSIIKTMLLIHPFPVPILGVSWTLEYEVFFYIIFGFFILNKNFIYLFIAILIYVKFYYTGDPGSYLYVDFMRSQTMLLFFLGIALAYLVKFKVNDFVLYSILILGGILLVLEILNQIFEYDYCTSYTGIIVGGSFSCIMFFVIKLENSGYDFRKYVKLNILGNASYALYLMHNPIIMVIAKISILAGVDQVGIYGALLSFAIMVFVSVFMAILFHLYIETPMLNYLKIKFIK